MNVRGNFLKEHYDWIAAAVAAAALVAGVVVFVGSLGTDGGELAADKTGEISRMKFGGEPAKAADMTDFTAAARIAKTPILLQEVTEEAAGNFLASERRVFCENKECGAVMPAGAKVCPLCNYERKEEVKVVVDADGDGMPDEWEKKYGLNVSDPADAEADGDNDGFTNMEEFTAKTDPKDAKDHPDYLDSLKLTLPLKQTFMPFSFTGAYKTPSGMKFQFKDPSRAKEYDRGVYSLLAGEEIGKSGYTAKEYVQKSEKRKMGGGMEKTVDVSEAVVVRKGDGKAVRMRVGQKQIPVDVQATLVYERGETKNLSVVAGDVIELNGVKYAIKSIAGSGKKVKVTIEEVATKKIKILEALES